MDLLKFQNVVIARSQGSTMDPLLNILVRMATGCMKEMLYESVNMMATGLARNPIAADVSYIQYRVHFSI